ncbi:hypothetical protein BRC65_07205 [Halobacteriales archaeon QH_2_65_14]|nr:MAG: hypothetical protein BRC65_07205 [Halobacteriales archaeon QH_2_65_14]
MAVLDDFPGVGKGREHDGVTEMLVTFDTPLATDAAVFTREGPNLAERMTTGALAHVARLQDMTVIGDHTAAVPGDVPFPQFVYRQVREELPGDGPGKGTERGPFDVGRSRERADREPSTDGAEEGSERQSAPAADDHRRAVDSSPDSTDRVSGPRPSGRTSSPADLRGAGRLSNRGTDRRPAGAHGARNEPGTGMSIAGHRPIPVTVSEADDASPSGESSRATGTPAFRYRRRTEPGPDDAVAETASTGGSEHPQTAKTTPGAGGGGPPAIGRRTDSGRVGTTRVERLVGRRLAPGSTTDAVPPPDPTGPPRDGPARQEPGHGTPDSHLAVPGQRPGTPPERWPGPTLTLAAAPGGPGREGQADSTATGGSSTGRGDRTPPSGRDRGEETVTAEQSRAEGTRNTAGRAPGAREAEPTPAGTVPRSASGLSTRSGGPDRHADTTGDAEIDPRVSGGVGTAPGTVTTPALTVPLRTATGNREAAANRPGAGSQPAETRATPPRATLQPVERRAGTTEGAAQEEPQDGPVARDETGSRATNRTGQSGTQTRTREASVGATPGERERGSRGGRTSRPGGDAASRPFTVTDARRSSSTVTAGTARMLSEGDAGTPREVDSQTGTAPVLSDLRVLRRHPGPQVAKLAPESGEGFEGSPTTAAGWSLRATRQAASTNQPPGYGDRSPARRGEQPDEPDDVPVGTGGKKLIHVGGGGTTIPPGESTQMPSLTLRTPTVTESASGDPGTSGSSGSSSQERSRSRETSKTRSRARDSRTSESQPRQSERRLAGSTSGERDGGPDSSRPPKGRDTSTMYPELTVKTLAPRIDVTRREETRRDVTHRPAEGDRGGRDPASSAEGLADVVSGRNPTGGTQPADVNRMVERLYREIERKRRIERERRGL